MRDPDKYYVFVITAGRKTTSAAYGCRLDHATVELGTNPQPGFDGTRRAGPHLTPFFFLRGRLWIAVV